MKPVFIDNLSKYGSYFQSKILAVILMDRGFLERVFDIINPDDFESDAHKWILKEIIDYFSQYKSLPTQQVFKLRIDVIQNAVLKNMVIDQLITVYRKVKDEDHTFIKEQFLEFCKNQKLKSAIYESAKLLETADYDKIKISIDKAMKAGMERKVGHDYHKDIAIRMNEMCRKVSPTGWEVIDSLMDGGLGPGELGVVVSPAGLGKSWVLCAIGAMAMKAGKNVAHFTLELNESYVGLRYDCCFTGLKFQEIRKYSAEVERKIENIPGRLIVKYFPLKTVSAQSLKYHIEQIQMVTGLHIDLMIVDYADILRQLEKEKNSSTYSEMGGIYEELRQVAGELQIPCWTASQTNRTGLSVDFVQAENVSDSYKKIMTADFVLSMMRTLKDKMNGTARFHVIKNRFGADGITFYSHMDCGNGNIRIYGEKSREGLELKATMDMTDEPTKNDLIRSKWNAARQKQHGENTEY
jgi:replicative DNA helicase